MSVVTIQRPGLWDILNRGQPYEPFPWQVEHIHAPVDEGCKRIILPCGRRSGKSRGVVAEIAREVPKPPVLVKGVWHSPIVYVGGPTAEASMRVFEPVWDAFVPSDSGSYQPPLGALYAGHDKNRGVIFIKGGARIYRKTADDPRSMQGERVTLAIPDEAHDWNEEAWENLMPGLADSEGRLIAIGIPKGKGRFRSYYHAGQGVDSQFHSASVPTTANPIFVERALALGLDPIDYLRQTFGPDLTSKEFDRQYLARWVEEDGQVFAKFEHLFTSTGESGPGPHIMGLDLGKLHDFTVAYIGDVSRQEFVARERFNKIDYLDQVPRIAQMYKDFACRFIHMDTNGPGEAVAEMLKELGCIVIPFQWSNTSKQALVSSMVKAVERSEVRFLADDLVLRKEMELFEGTVTPGGVIKYEAPRGFYDDCLREGTLIKTSTGYERIENIEPGDLVFTHAGRLQPVEACIRKPFDGEMHRMTFQGQLALDLSYNHPLYAAKRDYSGDRQGPYTRRDWVLPGDWRRTYRSVTPLIAHSGGDLVLREDEFYENAAYAHPVLREWALDSEAALLLGRFLADGHARRSSIGYGMEIAFHEREADVAEQFRGYLDRLGISTRTEPFADGGRGFKLVWSSKLMWHALRECYDEDSEKRLPAWGYRLNEHLPHVLDQWLAGDGWRHNKIAECVGATTSKTLALEMRDIALATGRAASISRQPRHRYGKTSKDQFWVAVHDGWPSQAWVRRISEGEAASHCRSHESYQYEGDVFNLQVAEDRSFIADGMVVHNCVIAAALLIQKMARNRTMTDRPTVREYARFGASGPSRRSHMPALPRPKVEAA